MFGEQLPQLDESDERTLITLTVGGNDLLSAFASIGRAPSLLERIARDVAEAYDFLLDAIAPRATRTRCCCSRRSTIPSDRIGRIPGVLEDAGRCRSPCSMG